MTQKLVYYTCTDAHICQKSLQKQGYLATVVPTPLVRSRSTYLGTIEQFKTLLTLALRYEYTDSGAKDIIQIELASLKHFLEKLTNHLATFYETYQTGSSITMAKFDEEPIILGPGNHPGYLDDFLKNNGIIAPDCRTVMIHQPVLECRIERPSFGLETLAPDLLEKSRLTIVTEHVVEYRFEVTTNADATTLASLSKLGGIMDSISCCYNTELQLQILKTRILERIQNTTSGLSLSEITDLLERPVQTAPRKEEYFRLSREFLKLLLYELGQFRLD